MDIETLLRRAAEKAEHGSLQRQQVEMLLGNLHVAKQFGFRDLDIQARDEFQEFQGRRFDEETKNALLKRGFRIFAIRSIPCRIFDYASRKTFEYEPEEREVAILWATPFITKTRTMSFYKDHVGAIEEFRRKLREEIWSVDVIMADVGTYQQLEDQVSKASRYSKDLFRLNDKQVTRVEVFTSSTFGDKSVTYGQCGRGWGTTYSRTTLIDPEDFDATTARMGYDQRVFMALPVVVLAQEPFFILA